MKYIILLILFVTPVTQAKPTDIIESDCDTEADEPPKIPSVDIVP